MKNGRAAVRITCVVCGAGKFASAHSASIEASSRFILVGPACFPRSSAAQERCHGRCRGWLSHTSGPLGGGVVASDEAIRGAAAYSPIPERFRAVWPPHQAGNLLSVPSRRSAPSIIRFSHTRHRRMLQRRAGASTRQLLVCTVGIWGRRFFVLENSPKRRPVDRHAFPSSFVRFPREVTPVRGRVSCLPMCWVRTSLG